MTRAFCAVGTQFAAPRTVAPGVRYGSSPLVGCKGEGIFFLEEVRDGVWRLEVHTEAVPVRDPFETPSADRIVTRAIEHLWPMRITPSGLGAAFTVTILAAGSGGPPSSAV